MKICVIVNNRANYGRIKSFMQAAKKHPDIELQLVVGAAALLYRFGSAIDIIRADGFEPNATTYSIVEGETPATMARSTGLGIMELASEFERLKPDIVLTVADRFDTMATAIAASYMNIPLAHTQGGELTGSIDESVRHAITKLAHIHFPATEQAGAIIKQMGENPDNVHVVGCPAIDLVAEAIKSEPENLFEKYGGTGAKLDWDKPYIVVVQHPVTTEYGQAFKQTTETLEAVKMVGMQTVWLWPNIDAGSDAVSKALRLFKDNNGAPIHFYRNFSPEDYVHLIDRSRCIVGNSSSGIRESGFLGVPSVNIGSRQDQREKPLSVINANGTDEIYGAIMDQVKKRYLKDFTYGDGAAGRRIADILAGSQIDIKKRFFYGG